MALIRFLKYSILAKISLQFDDKVLTTVAVLNY